LSAELTKTHSFRLFFDSSFQTPMDNSVETTGTGSFYCCQNISMITDTNAIKTKFMDWLIPVGKIAEKQSVGVAL